MRYKNLEIIPANIYVKVGETIQLTVVGERVEDGQIETVGNIVWQEMGGGGHIDSYAVLYPINAGVFKIKAIARDIGTGEEYEEQTIEIDYTVVDEKEVKSWAEKLREARLKAADIVSKKHDPTNTEKAEKENEEPPKERKFSIMSTTRAFFRTASANTDLVWLVFLIIFCVAFGCCTILLLSGVSVEKILAFCGSFFAMMISILGKFYSPPGELAQEIQEKMLGATPDEKVKNLEKQKEQIDRRIQAYTTKKRPIAQGFFKFSIDERNQPKKE